MPALKVYDGTTWQYLNGGTAPPIRLGYAQVVANQASITTTTDLTGLTATVNVAAGRTIKITAHIRAAGTNNDNIAELHIQEGGTVLALDRVYLGSTASGLKTLHAEVVLTPTAASHTYKLTLEMSTGAGSVSLAAGATFPAFILVEDITGGSQTGSSVVIDAAHARRTAGDITVNNTSWTDLDNNLDLVLTAAVGDEVWVSASGFWSNAGVYAFLDCVSIVGGSPVNSWASNGAPNASGQGVRSWWGKISSDEPIGGTVARTLVSGDISSGTVTLRLRYRTFTATNRTFLASTADQFCWGAQVLRPPA